MTDAEREATRKRLLIWQRAAASLDGQHWRELMALTGERALWMTRALLSRRVESRTHRDTSGLVQQQALFHKSRPG